MSSARPTQLEDLFFDGEAYPDWVAFNWKHRRFFLLNGSLVAARLRIAHSQFGDYLTKASQAIEDETDWQSRYGMRFTASRTQIYPDTIQEPKLLDKVGAIIVAFDLWAKAQNREINVYDYLRIVPAYYFVDGFDSDALEFLRRENVEKNLAAEIDQPERLLRELAWGFTVTKSVAERLEPHLRNLGLKVSVERAGPFGGSEKLGRKNAAPSLRLPLIVDVPPLRLESGGRDGLRHA